MTTIAEAAAALRTHDNFVILTHVRPDGDTLCSACALCSALRRMGKTAVLFPNPEITENFANRTAPYLAEKIPAEGYVVSVDVAGTEMFPRGFQGKADLCIDHHPSNPHFAPVSLVCPEKAACGEIIMELIELLCGELTEEEADLLYMAISTDTGCFCYANTTADTLRAAAHTIDCGADSHQANKLLFRSFSFARLKLEGMIFASLRSYRSNQINVAVIPLRMMEESGATENDCDDLASLAGKVRGNVVAITVREIEPGRSKASVRTNETVDASAICGALGGGGHKMASGCTVDVGPEELAELILREVEKVWPA